MKVQCKVEFTFEDLKTILIKQGYKIKIDGLYAGVYEDQKLIGITFELEEK